LLLVGGVSRSVTRPTTSQVGLLASRRAGSGGFVMVLESGMNRRAGLNGIGFFFL